MATLRTPEITKRYQLYLKTLPSIGPCILCAKQTLKEFEHWKIVLNDFPYDRIAKTHHMLIPYRHVQEGGLNEEEFKELRKIKETYVNTEYDWIMEPVPKGKTIPSHFHLHLILGKEEA